MRRQAHRIHQQMKHTQQMQDLLTQHNLQRRYLIQLPYNRTQSRCQRRESPYTTSRPYKTSPTTSRPYTKSPTTSRPYTTSPTTNRPYTTNPTTNRPYTTSPMVSPTTKRSYTTIPTTKRSYTTIPTTKRSYTTIPTTKRPYTTIPTTKSPYTTIPTTKRSYTTIPTTKRSYTTIPTTKRSYTTIPTTKRSYTTIPTTKRSYTTIPTTKRSYTTIPTTKRSYTTVPTTKRLYTTSPTMNKSYQHTRRPSKVLHTIPTTRKALHMTPRPKAYTTIPTTSRPYTMNPTTNKPYITKCPEASGVFRNPKDCGSFIHCSNFIPYFKECPDGLHFNVETKRCDYPCASKCDGSLACVSSSAVPPTTLNPLCPDGHQRKGIALGVRHSIPACTRCDWAHRVDCQHSEICPKRNGLFPYKGDCQKFIRCSNGIPYTKGCPRGLQFDPETLRCTVAPGPCGSVPSTNETRSKSKQPAPGAAQWRCPSSFGYYRHEGKCNLYYFCNKGVAHLKECPEGLHFNSKYGTCDWPKDVKCRYDQSRMEKRCRRFTEDFQCPANRSYVANSHCDMFFDCRTGKACAKKCPEGLYFNWETSMCDLPTNVRCKKRDGGSYSLKRFAEICRHGYKVQAVDPATNKCYYKCHHDKLGRFCCPGTHIYNEQRGKCERRAAFHLPFESRVF
ncbi:Protein obstructor-E like protein [Argiope bruennichi]|uniref:Protein obstructor-E like protein n=1 Tax=Argiope bruennichi TaxID=94029 RepID=A0A8T0FI72_ARGBR|nr:Protein obstructor-E like protein [Argiope bruennichi]